MQNQQLTGANPTGLQIDITQSVPIKSEDGNQIFQEAMVLRKISKFLVGSNEDMVVPIPVMIDIKTGKILIEMLPKDLQEEYKEYNKNLDELIIPNVPSQERSKLVEGYEPKN